MLSIPNPWKWMLWIWGLWILEMEYGFYSECYHYVQWGQGEFFFSFFLFLRFYLFI